MSEFQKKPFLAHIPASCPVCGCRMEDAGTTTIPVSARKAVCPNCGYIAEFAERSDSVQVQDETNQPSQHSNKNSSSPAEHHPEIFNAGASGNGFLFSRLKFRFMDVIRKRFLKLQL